MCYYFNQFLTASKLRIKCILIKKIAKKPRHKIPRQLPEEQFNAHVLPHLSIGSRGPTLKLPLSKIFNYILKVIHTGVQWDQMEIEKDASGNKEIHYTRIFRVFQRWSNDGSLKKVFEKSVCFLRDNNKLNLSVVHGDGSLTPAKKGGEMVAYNGHKKIKGEAILPVVDRNVNVLSPYITAPANRNESPLFKQVIDNFKTICEKTGLVIKGSIFSWDASINCPKNRKLIFNAGMTPNINENKRNRKKRKRGRKQIFDVAIYKERLRTIERLFAWEDSFKKLLIRFERKSNNHFGMKLIAYTMINLRHFF